VECHIVGYSGDLYGQQLAVDLLSELRPSRTFGSVADLVAQIRRDVGECVKYVEVSHLAMEWKQH
jgi:riboflavin kinase/FMN adenylyltransferase